MTYEYSPVEERVKDVRHLDVKHIPKMRDRYAAVFECFFERTCDIEYLEHRGDELIILWVQGLQMTYNVDTGIVTNEKTEAKYRNGLASLNDMLRTMNRWAGCIDRTA